jgi:hypothetical protein
MRFSASPLGKSLIHFGRNSKNSDLAVTTGSNFSKADPQIPFTRGRDVPILLKNFLFGGRKNISASVTIFVHFDRGYIKYLNSRHRPSHHPPDKYSVVSLGKIKSSENWSVLIFRVFQQK